MRLSICLGDYLSEPDGIGEETRRIARFADDVGVDSIWVGDHFFNIRGSLDVPIPEVYTTLAFLAGCTRRVRLGASVTAVHHRHPGVLLKMVSTLDALSGGRAWLGLGAGWNERESRGLGIPFPPLAERYEMLEETLRIARHMFAGDTAPFHGKHYDLAEPVNVPNALQRPHPPILVAGGGERKTFRLVAEYADACNLRDWPGFEEDLPAKLAALRARCEDAGRSYDQVEKTVVFQNDTTDRDEFLARMRRYADAGLDHALVVPPVGWDDASLELLAGVLPDTEKLTPAGR
jgi:F420-dependent oxidoreductase-like protein